MTNHYRTTDGPPCRCAYCLAQPRLALAAWRQVQRAIREMHRRRMDAERRRELAEWLAQDVH